MGAEEAKASKPVVRTRPWAWALLIILAVLPLLYLGLCAPLDITDNPARNGGFSRGRIFVVQSPVYVSTSDNGPGWAMRREQGIAVPVGTRVQIIKITYHRDVLSDMVLSAQPMGHWLDGPLAGKEVNLQGVCKRTPEGYSTYDPMILLPADAGSRPGAP